MGKQSAFAKAVQREVNIQLQLYGRNRMQLAEDAAFMAANEVLGLGSGRARAFGEAFDVMMMIVFLKFTLRPLESVI